MAKSVQRKTNPKVTAADRGPKGRIDAAFSVSESDIARRACFETPQEA